MNDPNLLYDEERFVGAKYLVSLLEAESGFTQSLSLRGRSKRTSNVVGREGLSNIGSLGEGTLHLVLKNYISANRENQEVKFGKKIIDVFLDDRAYEIQTSSFSSLKSKLSEFLPKIPVTIVYPVIREKRIAWTDPETGEVSSYRKSPKKETLLSVFNQLVYIKDFLKEPNLSFCVFELSVDETKLLCGYSKDKKKGSVRLNRIPTKLHATTQFATFKDFAEILPKDTAEFSVKMLSKHLGINVVLARKIIYCMNHAGIITLSKTYKREKYYKITEEI